MFFTRLITAGALLAVFVSALFFLSGAGWTALLVLALAVAAWEWGSLSGLGGSARHAYSGVLCVTALALWLAGGQVTNLHAAVYVAGCGFWLIAVPAWLAAGWKVRSKAALGATGWFALVPAWLALTQLQAQPWRLLAVLAIIWVADTAAYLCGRAWGRNKLAPSISPAKTWEGVAGAVAAVAVYYAVLSAAVPDWTWWQGPWGVVLFAGVILMAVVGDLFESWMKRQAGVKDSGSLLPGHGGVLDRVDSIASSLPFAALLMLHVA